MRIHTERTKDPRKIDTNQMRKSELRGDLVVGLDFEGLIIHDLETQPITARARSARDIMKGGFAVRAQIASAKTPKIIIKAALCLLHARVCTRTRVCVIWSNLAIAYN